MRSVWLLRHCPYPHRTKRYSVVGTVEKKNNNNKYVRPYDEFLPRRYCRCENGNRSFRELTVTGETALNPYGKPVARPSHHSKSLKIRSCFVQHSVLGFRLFFGVHYVHQLERNKITKNKTIYIYCVAIVVFKRASARSVKHFWIRPCSKPILLSGRQWPRRGRVAARRSEAFVWYRVFFQTFTYPRRNSSAQRSMGNTRRLCSRVNDSTTIIVIIVIFTSVFC
jgi:hypothetical protein